MIAHITHKNKYLLNNFGFTVRTHAIYVEWVQSAKIWLSQWNADSLLKKLKQQIKQH